MTVRAIQFTRLVITVPRFLAQAYAAALIEMGVGAVEERDDAGFEECTRATPLPVETTQLWISIPEGEAVEPWQRLAETLYQAFAEQLNLVSDAFVLETRRVEQDYHAGWLAQLVPQALTDDLMLVPTTSSSEPLPGFRHLLFEPHPCFGDGSHPTTRLAARATQQYCETHPDATVLDVGTGNGVLAFVAAVSGAATVQGIDVDVDALQAAAHNAKLNQLEGRCEFSSRDLTCLELEFDWVVANLEPRTQLALLESIAARVRPGGRLALTGFLVEQSADIAESLPRLGFSEREVTSSDGYALLCWEKDGLATCQRGPS